MTESTFVVPTMHCGHCAATVESHVRTVAGVHGVVVDLDTKHITVRGDDFAAEDVRAAVARAGYEAA